MILQCLQINWNVFRSFSVCAFNLLNFYLLLSLVLRFVIPFHVRSAWKIELFWFNRDFRLDGESLRSESASHHRIKLFCVRLARLSFIQQHIVRHETMTWNWNFDKIDRLMADFVSLSFAMQICNPWFSRQFGLFRLFFSFRFAPLFHFHSHSLITKLETFFFLISLLKPVRWFLKCNYTLAHLNCALISLWWCRVSHERYFNFNKSKPTWDKPHDRNLEWSKSDQQKCHRFAFKTKKMPMRDRERMFLGRWNANK